MFGPAQHRVVIELANAHCRGRGLHEPPVLTASPLHGRRVRWSIPHHAVSQNYLMSPTKSLQNWSHRFDAWQQRSRPFGFLVGVIRKAGDDRVGSLAALVTYYAFLSLFPLLLVVVTVLGKVLTSNPELRERLVDSALRDIPIVGSQLGDDLTGLEGSSLVIAVGVAGSLWGALGVSHALQHAISQVWNVPAVDRPNVLRRAWRGSGLLGLLGAAAFVGPVVAGLAGDFGIPGQIVTTLGVVAVNSFALMLAFKILTPLPLHLSVFVPGAIVAGVGWTILQIGGASIVSAMLGNANDVYGSFAIVLGLLVWLNLGATITLYAAELNVVRTRSLWPRSLFAPPLTDSDRTVLSDLAHQEVRRPEEQLAVVVDGTHVAPSPPLENTKQKSDETE